jgi:hypothetical protein
MLKSFPVLGKLFVGEKSWSVACLQRPRVRFPTAEILYRRHVYIVRIMWKFNVEQTLLNRDL